MAEKDRIVCVSGAGGFVASWLIKHLLSHGYTVHGTLRNPGDVKHSHLWKLENAAEKLKIFKADILDLDTIVAAVQGCNGVFHVASPVPQGPVPNPGDVKHSHLWKLENAAEKLKIFKADILDLDTIVAAVQGCNGVFHVASPVPQGPVPNPEVELVEPAVNGTVNVLKACNETNVRRVVVVSSVAAVSMKPEWPKDQVMDERCWSDKEYCKETNNWYCYSKTVAEAEAWEYAKKTGLNVVTVCPSLILGPILQQTPNASSLSLINQLKEGCGAMENNLRKLVDVRDVAEALKLVYEKADAQGRYICSGDMMMTEDMLVMLKVLYPNYYYPQLKDGNKLFQLSSQKLQKLGWNHRPVKETLVDSIESYKQHDLIWF